MLVLQQSSYCSEKNLISKTCASSFLRQLNAEEKTHKHQSIKTMIWRPSVKITVENAGLDYRPRPVIVLILQTRGGAGPMIWSILVISWEQWLNRAICHEKSVAISQFQPDIIIMTLPDQPWQTNLFAQSSK